MSNTNLEYLHNYIKRVAKNEISNTDTSGVYTGVIKAVSSNYYEVTLNQSDSESTILAIAMNSVDVYEKDDYVYLLRAEISTTINYFIFGKVEAVQETFFNLTDAERFLEEKDASISANDFESDDKSITILKSTGSNKNTFNKVLDSGYFRFECNVSTAENSGNLPFGFKIEFQNEKEETLEEFKFDSSEFIGQPRASKYTAFNSKVFTLTTEIDKSAFQQIVVSKFAEDSYFTDFTADSVKIVAGSMLKVAVAYQNKVTISNDKNYFDKGENSTGLNNITLTSEIYYNNKKLSADTLQYYWLLKDDTATNEEANDYLEYAGNGWRCLNTMIKTNGINTDGNNIEIRLWDNKNNVIQLDKTTNAVSFSSFVNKAKCLVKYFDTFIESDIIDIYNYENEEFFVELSSTTDSKTIAFKNDKIILNCDIINQNDKIDIKNYIKEYRWYLEDPNGDINITPKDKEEKENTNYNTLTIFDSAYIDELEGNQYKFEEGKTQGRFYCAVTLKPKADAAGLLEKSESVLVDSKAAEVEVTQNIEYKYYIVNNHSVTFEETTRTAEGGNTINAGDWLINGDENLDWIGNFFDDEGNSKVFNDLTIFNNGNYNKTEEWFIYYTQRTVWKEGGIIFKTEYWTFPQIARSIIHTTSDGWKNHRIGNSTTQLNTFNQLTNNGTDDGVYYADLGQLTKDTNPDPSKTYYTKDIDGNYTPIQLNITWDFKRDKEGKLEEYYKWDSEKEEYIQVVDVEGQPAVYDSTVTYYKKDGDDYRKLEVNLNNFKAVNTVWSENISNPTQEVYENIDNKLFINATYIRSGTLEVKDKFYASIDQEDVRIAGFNVNDDSFSNLDGSIYIGTDGVHFTKERLNADVVSSIEMYYLQNDAPDNKPSESDSNWSTKYPKWENGKYIWQKTITYYANNTDETQIICITGAVGPQGEPGVQGEDGKYIEQIIEQYYLSDSNVVPDTAIWIDIIENSILPIEKGKLRFRRQKYIWSDNGITYSVAKMDETDQRIVDWCAETDSTLIDGGSIYCESLSTITAKLGDVESIDPAPIYGYKNRIFQGEIIKVPGIVWSAQDWSVGDGKVRWHNIEEINFTINFFEDLQIDSSQLKWNELKVLYIEYKAANLIENSFIDTGGLFKQDIDLLTLNNCTIEVLDTVVNISIPAGGLTVMIPGVNEAAAKPEPYIAISHSYILPVYQLIKGAKISLSDEQFILFPNFSVDNQGNLISTNINATGIMNISDGSLIGGFTVVDNVNDKVIGLRGLRCGFNSDSYLSTSGEKIYTFWAGAPNAEDAQFKVSNYGELYSTKGKIGGWDIFKNGLLGLGEIVTELDAYSLPAYDPTDRSLKVSVKGGPSFVTKYQIDEHHPLQDERIDHGSLSIDLGKYYTGDKYITINLCAASKYSERDHLYSANTMGNLDGIWSLNRTPLNLIASGSFQAIPEYLATGENVSDKTGVFTDAPAYGLNEQTNLFTYLSLSDCETYGCSVKYIQNYKGDGDLGNRQSLPFSLPTNYANIGAVIYIEDFDLKNFNRAYVKAWCSPYLYDEDDLELQPTSKIKNTAATRSLIENLRIQYYFGKIKTEANGDTIIKPYVILYPNSLSAQGASTMSELRIIVHYEIYGYNGPNQSLI